METPEGDIIAIRHMMYLSMSYDHRIVDGSIGASFLTAVAKALPSLAGKLTSNAIRVPVPNGSLVVLNLEVGKATSIEEVNAIMKKYALEGELVEQIRYSLNNELVSSDIVGTAQPSIYDSNATIVSGDGKNIVLYVWYDNEYGYSHQVIRLAKYIAKVRRYTYY